jgi:hypothetical protein
MSEEVIQWGIKAQNITSDCWYSSRDNLHFFKNQELDHELRTPLMFQFYECLTINFSGATWTGFDR